jgi:methylated-DNA-[protein]-cysteine S-methyltransferase
MGTAVRKVEGWGWIGVGTTEKGVARIVLPKSSKKAVEKALQDFRNEVNQSLAENCLQAISRYLKGEPVAFEQIPIDWDFVPPIYRRILLTLRQIVPLGQTITYGKLARRLGMPRAARLVGQAMAKNPVPILVPCHRVIRSNGSSGGFSGGANLKRKLLDLEQHMQRNTPLTGVGGYEPKPTEVG